MKSIPIQSKLLKLSYDKNAYFPLKREDNSRASVYVFYKSSNKWKYQYCTVVIQSNAIVHLPLHPGEHWILKQSIHNKISDRHDFSQKLNQLPPYSVWSFEITLMKLCVHLFHSNIDNQEKEHLSDLTFLSFIENTNSLGFPVITTTAGVLPNGFISASQDMHSLLNNKNVRNSYLWVKHFLSPLSVFRNEVLPLYKFLNNEMLTRTHKEKLLKYHSIKI